MQALDTQKYFDFLLGNNDYSIGYCISTKSGPGYYFWYVLPMKFILGGERGGSVVECRTPEREVRGSRPTSAVLCP